MIKYIKRFNGGDKSVKIIAIIDDDVHIGNMIEEVLQSEGYSVIRAYSGTEALYLLKNNHPDLVLLDLMLPGLSGEEVLPHIKTIPVIIISAKVDIDSKVDLLMSGAADYLTKPFDTKELLATIRAITRTQFSEDTKIRLGNLTLDRATFELSSPAGSFRLANKEFQMLGMFMANPGCVISAEKFMEKIWGFDTEAEVNVVWVYISYLRKKLAALNADVQIKALRNAGYLMEEAND